MPNPWYHLKEGYHPMLNNPGEHSAASYFNATLHGYITIPTSGNIGGRSGTGWDYIIHMSLHETVCYLGPVHARQKCFSLLYLLIPGSPKLYH